MAAPKEWGFTRNEPIRDEILVSWADGDLTAIVSKEVDERLLAHADERRVAAAYARCALDAQRPREGDRDWLLDARPGVIDRCVQLADDPSVDFDDLGNAGPSSRVPLPMPSFGMMFGLGTALLVAAAALWIFLRAGA